MPKLSQRVTNTQAASLTTPNALNGTNLQYIGLASVMSIWAALRTPAAAVDSFSLSYSRGAEFGVIVPAGTSPNVNANGPQQLNDLIGDFPIPAGANLVLAVVSDATAGNHIMVFAFEIKS